MFPFTAGPPCERVLFDHSPFYGGSLLRADAGTAATATLSRFVSILSGYFDAIRAWVIRWNVERALHLRKPASSGSMEGAATRHVRRQFCRDYWSGRSDGA